MTLTDLIEVQRELLGKLLFKFYQYWLLRLLILECVHCSKCLICAKEECRNGLLDLTALKEADRIVYHEKFKWVNDTVSKKNTVQYTDSVIFTDIFLNINCDVTDVMLEHGICQT